ncbi:MAG: ABC transporter substrate-binding protein, partial [Gammaproteobacteria bacterium]|nr:ABC transporter substrate-binding protein [Gammaproteobacteria bacterium]
MKQLRRKIVGVMIGGLLGSALHAAEPELPADGPHATVRRATDDLIAVIEAGKTYFDTDPEKFYSEIERVLDPIVDFESFARGVMAVYYRKASPAQRVRFHDTFKSGLVRTYGKALLDFGDQEIVVLPPDKPARQPDRDSVTMEVRSSEGKIYPVVYSMARGDGGRWRMRNIIINGINIGLTYRNQFASAMKSPKNRNDLDAVIDEWSVTVADVDPIKDGDSAKESD